MKTKTVRAKEFHRKLVAYSATAGAALLAAPATHAAIHNITKFSTDGGTTFGTTAPDVKADVTTFNQTNVLSFTAASTHMDIGIKGFLSVEHSSLFSRKSGFAGIGQYFAHTGLGTGGIALKLGPNDPIAATSQGAFGGVVQTLGKRYFSNGTYAEFGQFMPQGANAAVSGYVGFRAVNHLGTGSKTYYGWLHVKVANDGSGFPYEVALMDQNGNGVYGAFGLASDHIKAGEVAPIPEPSVEMLGGLGLLALGAEGVREMRRRRKSV